MLENKICKDCKELLSLALFSKDNSKADGLQSRCKKCQAKRNRAYYEKNKRRHYENTKRQRRKVRQMLTNEKVKSGCIYCGIKHPAVLDFHHKDPSTKLFTIAQYSSQYHYPIATLMVEVRKCEVLCANCHRLLHYNERINNYDNN